MLNRAITIITLGLMLLGLTSCGGSSHKHNRQTLDTWQPEVFFSADNYANQCAVPRKGIDLTTNRAYPDTQATVLEENNFLRSWSNDTYLWYQEIQDMNPALFLSTDEYFQTLKTTQKTASGKDKDNFHFTYPTTVWDGLINSGVETGYGISWAWLSATPPRNFVVSYTEPGSPAAINNLQRGTKLLKIDGIDFVNSNDVDVINAGLFPSAHGESHSFEVQDYGSTTTRTIVLQSTEITKVPVQNVTVLNSSQGKVGYFLFNDHLATAEQGLVSAITQFKQNNVTELVLDVRYNGGGYLYIASELAYMIAGRNATKNKTFEKTMFNNKHTKVGLYGESLQAMGFSSTSDNGSDLPSLNLKRVFVITSGNTCSASEAVINGLRGVDIEVIQIGSKTCGKPYGFYGRDNCGTTYFTIQFKGVNHKGFGEYADGFAPAEIDNGLDAIKGCSSGDDFTHILGDPNELNVSSALYYLENGACPPAAMLVDGNGRQKMASPSLRNVNAALSKEQGLTNRIMRP